MQNKNYQSILSSCIFTEQKKLFLYSQNTLPHLIILLGLAFSGLPPKMMFLTCIPFISYQFVSNSIMMFMVEKHVNLNTLKHNHIVSHMLCALIVTVIVHFIDLAIKKLIRKDVFEQSVEKRFALYLGIYIIYILITCIFLGIFHSSEAGITPV